MSNEKKVEENNKCSEVSRWEDSQLEKLKEYLCEICPKDSILCSTKDQKEKWHITLKEKDNEGTIQEYVTMHNQPFLAFTMDKCYKPKFDSIINTQRKKYFFDRKCDYVLLVEGYIVFVELKSSISTDDNKDDAGQQLFISCFHWRYIKEILLSLPNLLRCPADSLDAQITPDSFPNQYRFCVLAKKKETISTEYAKAFLREPSIPFRKTGMEYNILRRNRQIYKISDMINLKHPQKA